jgi:peptidyl-prolyl cis-trans isomerase A (cyclophilin A)
MGAVLATISASGCAGQAARSPRARLVPVVIETERGNIEAVLDSTHAPLTAANFLRYVDAQLFDSARFFRAVRLDNQPNDSVKIQVIQVALSRANGGREFPPIPLERTSETGLRHADGVLSMARSRPNTATSSFSIVIAEQPSMDFGGHRQPDGQGFAVFGRVTKGMDVVHAIQAGETNGQNLKTPVRIIRIRRQ